MLWDLLSTAGHILDTPGAIFRAALAGENPLPGVFDPSQRVYGRDLLERYGMLGANEEGLDWGDAAGLGVEMATDPLNLLGGALFKRLLGNRAAARAKVDRAVEPLVAAAQRKHALAQTLGDEEALARSLRAEPPGYGPVSSALDSLDAAKLGRGRLREPLEEAALTPLRVGRQSEGAVADLLEGFGVGGRNAGGGLDLVGPPSVTNVPGLTRRGSWVGAEPIAPHAVTAADEPLPTFLDSVTGRTTKPPWRERYDLELLAPDVLQPAGLAGAGTHAVDMPLDVGASLAREAATTAQQQLQDMLARATRINRRADSQQWREGGLLGSLLLNQNVLARSRTPQG